MLLHVVVPLSKVALPATLIYMEDRSRPFRNVMNMPEVGIPRDSIHVHHVKLSLPLSLIVTPQFASLY